jgi:hypothetical protein
MSPEAQDAFIGKLVRKIGESNRAVAALENELDHAGDSLKNAGSLLKLARRDPTETTLYESTLDSAITNIPSQETLRTLLRDLREQRQLQHDLRMQASKIGISV